MNTLIEIEHVDTEKVDKIEVILKDSSNKQVRKHVMKKEMLNLPKK